MDRMANILQMIRLDELAGHFLEGRSDSDVTHHTAKDMEDVAYQKLEAALDGVERKQTLAVLEAAVDYGVIVENAAFVYGMKTAAQLLKTLFTPEEPLF